MGQSCSTRCEDCGNANAVLSPYSEAFLCGPCFNERVANEDADAAIDRGDDHQMKDGNLQSQHLPNVTFNADELIPVRDIPSEIKRLTGSRTKVDLSTVYRWLKVGNRGAKLRRVYVGKVAHVKRQWLEDFILDTEPQSITKPIKGERKAPRKVDESLPKWRQRQLEDVHKRAERLGLV